MNREIKSPQTKSLKGGSMKKIEPIEISTTIDYPALTIGTIPYLSTKFLCPLADKVNVLINAHNAKVEPSGETYPKTIITKITSKAGGM
jgi:hypothetical protein